MKYLVNESFDNYTTGDAATCISFLLTRLPKKRDQARALSLQSK